MQKLQNPEQHANGRPWSAGMTDKLCVCVCVSDAVGMESLLYERNQWGSSLYMCVRGGEGYVNNGRHCLPISLIH